MDSAIEIAGQTDAVPASPGSELAALRKSQKLSVAEVAQRLKYGTRQIEALELDDYSKLPGATFLRGMIRSYAKLLGVDPASILQQLDRQYMPGPQPVDLRAKQIPFPDKTKRATRTYAALSALAIAVTCIMGYELYSGASLLSDLQERYLPAQETPSPQMAAAPVDAPPVAPFAAPVAEKSPATFASAVVEAAPSGEKKEEIPVDSTVIRKRIALQFDRESWVEIKQADGKTLLSQLNPAGTRQFVEGVPPFLLTIGNAPNVHVRYNDQLVDLRPHFKVDVARLTLD